MRRLGGEKPASLFGAAEKSNNVSIGITKVSQDSTPRLLLRRCNEFNSTVSKSLMRPKDIWHGKRNAHKATNKLFTL